MRDEWILIAQIMHNAANSSEYLFYNNLREGVLTIGHH